MLINHQAWFGFAGSRVNSEPQPLHRLVVVVMGLSYHPRPRCQGSIAEVGVDGASGDRVAVVHQLAGQGVGHGAERVFGRLRVSVADDALGVFDRVPEAVGAGRLADEGLLDGVVVAGGRTEPAALSAPTAGGGVEAKAVVGHGSIIPRRPLMSRRQSDAPHRGRVPRRMPAYPAAPRAPRRR